MPGLSFFILINKVIAIVSVIIFLISVGPVQAAEASKIAAKARLEAKAGKRDFAFLQYQALLRQSPEGKYKSEALFGLAEYYFSMTDYRDAQPLLDTCANECQGFEQKLFSLVYLLKLAQLRKDVKLQKELEQKVMALKKHVFIFSESKKYKYLSPLNQNYLAVYSIEKIEFFVGGKLLAKITY